MHSQGHLVWPGVLAVPPTNCMTVGKWYCLYVHHWKMTMSSETTFANISLISDH